MSKEKNVNINFEYESEIFAIASGDNLTAICYNYLKDKGVEVYKSTAPIGIFNHEYFTIKSHKIKTTNFVDAFEELYSYIKDKICILYEVQANYSNGFMIIRFTT